MEEKKSLVPSYNQLVSGDLDMKGQQNDLNKLLNCEPPKQWLKNHPFVKGVKYLPIGRVEYMLTKIFIRWSVEVKSVQLMANAAVVTVRLYYQDVLTDKTLFQDGVGGAPLQTDKGAGAVDFNAIKSDAVMKAAPAAESFAVKDAAEKIGKLFGRDLNRADQILYDELAKLPEKETKHEQIFNTETK
jgi:hypothetical protein